MDKTERNRENIKAVTDVLIAARYRSSASLGSDDGNPGMVEFWTGPGKVPVIVLQTYPDDNGFELWVPIAQTNDMSDTLYALRDATRK